ANTAASPAGQPGDNYLKEIESAVEQAGFPAVTVRFAVDAAMAEAAAVSPAGHGEQLRLPAMPEGRSHVRTLHPRYTFDEFMVGEANALAFSACEAIANGDTAVGPCVYIHSGTGLGKSHLTHAVAHHLLNHSPNLRLHYLTSQQLTAEVVRHIKQNTMEHFKEKYHRQCDVLLMEDVHTLAGRTKTQSELAEAVDVLMEGGRRIIFTGAVAPREIPNMDVGMRSRLSAGLITSINPPDLRTRRLIILRKAAYHNLGLGEELVDYLAEHVKGDIRRVESAIIGLKAKANLLKTAPGLEMVKEVVAAIVGQHLRLSSVLIRDFVARQFQVPVAEMQSKSRKKSVAFPRQVAMFLARKLTDEALSDIGKSLNRDHSTVVHSIRVITEAIARDGSIRGQVDHLSERLIKKYQ
ncbi:MAG TPA: chromosomal replication initiator protein DnaA, partial [Desulfurivibrionaceae bacterium]|nr:chromosomal replication initiator protein DnaA [Desulfurivibrionaceae bacterium]